MSVLRSVLARTGGGGGGATFNPASIAGLQQQLLTVSKPTLGGVITDKTGTADAQAVASNCASTASTASVINLGQIGDAGSGSLTVAFWVMIDTWTNGNYIATKGNNSGSTNPGWSISLLDDNKITLRTADETVTTAKRAAQQSPAVTTATWYHLAMVIDRSGGVILGYLNGTNTGWTSGGGGPTDNDISDFADNSSTEDFRIGKPVTTGRDGFDGKVCGLQVFQRALSAAEVLSIYNREQYDSSFDWSSVVIDCPLNEPSGTTTVYDVSGKFLTGTATGTVLGQATQDVYHYGLSQGFSQVVNYGGNLATVTPDPAVVLPEIGSFEGVLQYFPSVNNGQIMWGVVQSATQRFDVNIGIDHIMNVSFRNVFAAISSTTVFQQGRFYKILIQWTATTVKLFIDDILEGQATVATGTFPTNGIQLSGRAGTAGFTFESVLRYSKFINEDGSIRYYAGERPRVRRQSFDVFLIAGQSNAVGAPGGSGSSIVVPAGAAFESYGTNFIAVEDPIGTNGAYSNTTALAGSAWVNFCKVYNEETGRIPVIIQRGKSGTRQTAAGQGTNHWDDGGVLFTQAVRAVAQVLETCRNLGIDANFKGLLWYQGEGDGVGIQDEDITASVYQTALDNMAQKFHALFPGAHFFLGHTHNRNDVTDTIMQSIRDAQTAVAAQYTWMHIAAGSNVDPVMVDNVHLNQAALDTLGAEYANYVAGLDAGIGQLFQAAPFFAAGNWHNGAETQIDDFTDFTGNWEFNEATTNPLFRRKRDFTILNGERADRLLSYENELDGEKLSQVQAYVS